MTVLRLHTADGVALTAESAVPASRPAAAAVLLHPHPLMGGDMFAPVPQHLFEVLADRGVAMLRLGGVAAAAGHDPRPKHLLVPEHDQFTTPEAACSATAGWTGSRVEVIEGADHFLGGRLSVVADLVTGVLRAEQ